MRALACAAFAIAALALGGCGGSGSEPTWPGPPRPTADGSVAVDGFAEYAKKVDASWERSAAMAAAEFLRLDESTAARTSIEGRASAEGTGPETVTVTLDGLPDDSVRAERWELSFVQENGKYTLTKARWAQRCQRGRGHSTFSAAPCV